jgi:pSer/pThr/pTyr-binding forkhead associated (FHA) protein/S1-C subfamily serine protease
MPRIVIKELDSEKSLSVSDVEATLGRDPACGFVIEGPNSKVVSGRHARIFFQDSGWWIEDTSRNGTILDEERLQPGQRHALRVGQLIGLGESGPRYRVVQLESRNIADTLMEMPDLDAPASSKPSAPSTTAPRQAATPLRPPASAAPLRDGPNAPESTDPLTPSPDWLVHVLLRATNTNQLFDVRAATVKVGRSPDCNVQVPPEQGASVSRVHVEIRIAEGGVVVRDAASRNGTFLNGRHLDGPHPAMKGDLIMLGSGGPTFAIEDLHIVKAATASSSGQTESTPVEAKQIRDAAAGMQTPETASPRRELPTEPMPLSGHREPPKPRETGKPMGPMARLARRSLAGAERTPLFKDVLEDMPTKSAKRVRIIVWVSVAAIILIAGMLLGATQWQVSESERQVEQQRAHLEARSDSIRQAASAEAERLRASFDSARSASAPRAVIDSLRNALADASRRTGALEQALMRARRSLDQQLAAGDSARRRAEEEMTRLRTEVEMAQAGGEGSRAALESLRRALSSAEEHASDVALQVRAVRGSNLAQVAQLNQGAVGLLASFVGQKVVSGSGFAITPSGYFVTNRQVVTDDSGRVRDTIYVTMADQKFTLNSRVEVVALGAGDLDVAVLKIPDYRGPYMKNVDWNAGSALPGEPAVLIGFPYGVDLTLDGTSGNVVRTSMSAGIFSKVAADRIQFDGFTMGGSSGSPIFNSSGEVVAVHRGGPTPAVSIPIARIVALLPASARSELGIK